MEKPKRDGRGRGLTKRQKIILFGSLVFLVGMVFLVIFLTQGTWLTVRAGSHEDLVYIVGVDLSQEAAANNVLTYYAPKQWVALEWVGYTYLEDLGVYASVWHIPLGFVLDWPFWRANKEWRIDFYWPLRRGPFPTGAIPGTSSH